MVGVDRNGGQYAYAACDTGMVRQQKSETLEAQRKRYQRKLARQLAAAKKRPPKQRRSTRMERTRRKLAKTERKHDNQAASKTVAAIGGTVVIENLNVKGMTEKGTVENPGRKVKAKSGVNRTIIQTGWSQFAHFSGYKPARIEFVPFTSQDCNVCGHRDENSRPSQAHFECTGCGHIDKADINAAKNILMASEAGPSTRGGCGACETLNRQNPVIHAFCKSFRCLAVLIVAVLPQLATAQHLQTTVKVGVANTNFRVSNLPGPFVSPNSRLGITAGVGFGLDLHGAWGAHLEVNYVDLGADKHESDDSGSWSVDTKQRVRYLQISILAQYRQTVQRIVHARAFAGPFVGFRIGSAIEATYAGTSPFAGETHQGAEAISCHWIARCEPAALDYGLTLGAGLDLDWLLKGLTFEIRYLMGLKNLELTAWDWGLANSLSIHRESVVKNRSAAFLFGIRL